MSNYSGSNQTTAVRKVCSDSGFKNLRRCYWKFRMHGLVRRWPLKHRIHAYVSFRLDPRNPRAFRGTQKLSRGLPDFRETALILARTAVEFKLAEVTHNTPSSTKPSLTLSNLSDRPETQTAQNPACRCLMS